MMQILFFSHGNVAPSVVPSFAFNEPKTNQNLSVIDSDLKRLLDRRRKDLLAGVFLSVFFYQNICNRHSSYPKYV
jgi:hypothetical protein